MAFSLFFFPLAYYFFASGISLRVQLKIHYVNLFVPTAMYLVSIFTFIAGLKQSK